MKEILHFDGYGKMTILEKNIKALETRYGITDIFSNNRCDSDIVSEIINVNGKEILAVQYKNEYIRLDSLYESEKMLDCWYESIKEKIGYESVLFMYGLGNGNFVKTFIEKFDETTQIRVYEPSYNIFMNVLNCFDISELITNSRVILYLPFFMDNILCNRKMIDGITFADLGNLSVVSHLNYHSIFKDDYSMYYDNLRKDLLSVFIDAKFMGRWGNQLNENIFNNINCLIGSKSLFDLEKIIDNLPAIIVSAGPSLDKNVECLKNAKNKAVIIAVDSAVRTLDKRGIIPNIIVTGDPIKDEKYIDGEKCIDVPLVTSLRAGWKLNNTHRGIKYFCNTGEDFVQEFFSANSKIMIPLETGGSVANTAFTFARWIGCNTIILVGQDLAYPDDKTHAEDSVVANVSVEKLDGRMYVRDIFGNKVKTSDDMNRYREWFEKIIDKNPDLDVYDATEGGAYIKGTKIITLQEAIDKLCTKTRDISSLFENGNELLESNLKKKFIKYYEELPKRLMECKDKIQTLKTIYLKMDSLINKNNIYSNEMIYLSKQSNCILDEIESESAMCFVQNDSFDKLNSIFFNIKKVKSDEKEELKEIVDVSMKYINFLNDSIEKVLLIYDETTTNTYSGGK